MATKLTSIHKANDSNGFAVSFQIDHEVGANDFQMHITHSSPGRTRETELDIPLSEVPELIKSLSQMIEEQPIRAGWCLECEGAGEVPYSAAEPFRMRTCMACDGKGLRKNG